MLPSASLMTSLVGVELVDGGTPSTIVRTSFARDDSSSSEVEGWPTVQGFGALANCEGNRTVGLAMGC